MRAGACIDSKEKLHVIFVDLLLNIVSFTLSEGLVDLQIFPIRT